MSGWLLLGLPGAIFIAGLHEAWIGIGLWCGALINWIIVAPRLREQTERYDNALTIPAFLASRFPTKAMALRVVSAVVVVVFFVVRSEEHTSELQSLMRISYAVFCLKK